MADTNPQNNSQKNTPENTKSIQDFEMGSDEASKASGVIVPPQPTINKYPTNSAPTPTPAPKVDPTAGAPVVPTASSASPAATVPSPAPAPAAKPSIPSSPKSAPPMNPVAKRKAIIGCLGAFGSLMLILLILSFIFLAQSGETQNPIARLLGINQGVFINGLISFVHFIFILISLTTFVFTMIGLFKSSMAKRDDKETRKKGLKTALISGIVLFSVLIVWGFTYIYLDGKRVQVNGEILDPIVTDPEITTGLSAPVEVKFDAGNVPINKKKYQIVSHEWDFGDGETGTSQITSHIFKEKGVYQVKLMVTVKDKSTGELAVGGEYGVTVSVENQSLAAIIKAEPQSGEAPLEVSFDASGSTDPDGNIKSFEWDLDSDGQFDDGKGEKIEHTFEKVGKYKVSLRVTSTTDEFDIDEKEIIVEEETSPEAVITVVDDPKTFVPGLNYIFKADDSTSPNGKITKYQWSFSDSNNKTETTKTISHIFKQPGTYEVILKITDEKDEEGEMKKIIKVDSPKGSPKAKINTDPALAEGANILSGKAPFTVTFDAKQTTDSDDNIVDYKWDFDSDGKFDSFGNVVSHTYAQEGTYTVELEVHDADKNIGKASLVVKVESAGVVAVINADKVDGNVPLTVNFDASASSYNKGQITSYRWDFGDETPLKIGAATISHKYTAVGNYNASVTVTASDGSSTSKSITITVREIPLASCFSSVLESGKAPLETTFDPGCSTGAISNYFWDFGDGATSTSVKPTHEFKEPGEYEVTLEVSDAQNTVDLAEMTITVTE